MLSFLLSSKVPTLLILVLMSLSSTTIVSATFCRTILNNLPKEVQCEDCKARFRLRYGFNFGLTCQLDQTFCLDGDELCFKPKFSTDLSRRRKESSTEFIIDVDALLGDAVNNLKTKPGELEISVKHMVPIELTNPIQFESCQGLLADQPCTCTVCEGNTSIQLDCSKIKFESNQPLLPPFSIPAFPACLGF